MSDIRPHWHGDVNPGHPQGSRPAPQDVLGRAVAERRQVTKRRIDAAIATLVDLTTEEHESLDGGTRDEFGHVIHVLNEMLNEVSNTELATAWDEGYTVGGLDSTSPPGKWEDNPYLTEAENAERRARHIERLKQSGYR